MEPEAAALSQLQLQLLSLVSEARTAGKKPGSRGGARDRKKAREFSGPFSHMGFMLGCIPTEASDESVSIGRSSAGTTDK